MDKLERYLLEYTDIHPRWLDESRLIYVSSRAGSPQMWEVNLETRENKQRTFFNSKVCSTIPYRAGKQILFTLDTNGSENEQPFLIGYDETEPVNLIDRPKVLHRMAGFIDDGKKLVYMCNARDRRFHDVCIYDLETKEERIVAENETFMCISPSLSTDGKKLCYIADGGFANHRIWMMDLETGKTSPIPEDARVSRELNPAWKKDGSGLFLITDRDRDKSHVAYYDFATKELTSVYQSDYECTYAALSYDNKYLAVTENQDGYVKIVILNTDNFRVAAVPNLPKAGMRASAGDREQLAWAPGSYRIAFALSSGQMPARLWVYDMEKDAAEQVTDGGRLSKDEMVEVQLCSYKSYDGLEVPYWLYVPKGKKAENLPVLIEIHGGPESQTTCLYNAYLQYIVSEGIAVVAPNVRGSTGYGTEYCHLDDRANRLDAVKDIEALVKHLVDTGVADAKKMIVSGISYGGFMTLSCCARLPKLWACAVAQVGMFNLVTFLENTSDYRRTAREPEYGYLATEREMLFNVSPAAKVDDMETPIIIAHGANDPRVPVTEAEQAVAKLKDMGVEVEYLRYEDEGHGVVKMHNKLDCYKKIVAFIKKHI